MINTNRNKAQIKRYYYIRNYTKLKWKVEIILLQLTEIKWLQLLKINDIYFYIEILQNNNVKNITNINKN